MPFKHYRIVLRLLSPLHIGKRKYRNLMETREYVPGRTLWGALTARITRDCLSGTPKMYRIVGNKLTEHLRFGYLWPAVKISGKNDGKTEKFEVYFPWKAEERRDTSGNIEFTYEFVEPDAFDYLFKFGYMGQPIEIDRKATEEGQLHESEFIGPVTRDNRKVYLVGDMWIKDDILVNESEGVVHLEGRSVPLRKVFSNLQLGGEKGYGWGRVKYEKLEPTNGEKAIGDVDFSYENGEVLLEFRKDQHLTAHALAAEWKVSPDVNLSPIPGEEVQGPVEPLTGYEYQSLISNPPICYEPGGKLKNAITAHVGVFGILSRV